MKKITLLGSTGSVGENALNVIAQHPERFGIYALAAQKNWQKLVKQCQQWQPNYAVIESRVDALFVSDALKTLNIKTTVLYGSSALDEIASASDCQIVIAAIAGAAGLSSVLAAARQGKRILLANKEALVMSGSIFIQTCIDYGAQLLPIDSEHNAIHQCLPNNEDDRKKSIQRLILTASGGPFLKYQPIALAAITPAEACHHPIWPMGKKISVDSATMMNKGLEVIEACWLFDIDVNKVDVLIHPQSVIHSMVNYIDGSVLAQLSCPDMRIPIAYALAYPDRIATNVKALSLTDYSGLTFETPNLLQFPCLNLAYLARRAGDSMCTALNAANEIAVDAFLSEKISFLQIPYVVEETLEQVSAHALKTLEAVIDVDQAARIVAKNYVSKLLLNAA